MEDKWPPLKECPQYKYGMINPFLKVSEWEKEEHMDDSEFWDPNDEESYHVENAFEVTKRFLQQVRNTRGYEVDCRPPDIFDSPFAPLDVQHELARNDRVSDCLMNEVKFVIEKISEKTQKPYKLCSIERIIFTTHMMFLYTIKAKEEAGVGSDDAGSDGASSDAQTFYAMVYSPPGGDDELKLEELLIKPDGDAPTV